MLIVISILLFGWVVAITLFKLMIHPPINTSVDKVIEAKRKKQEEERRKHPDYEETPNFDET